MTTNITPTERVEQYETLARDFFQNHIPRVQGVNLSPALRWAIVQCALDALEGCPACYSDSSQLPNEACLRPGTKLLPIIQRMKHCEFPNVDIDIDDMLLDTTIMDSTTTTNATIVASDAAIAKSTLRNLIHTVINHQGRINQEWYEDTIQALKDSCGSLLSSSLLMPPGIQQEQNNSSASTTTSMIRVHSIFAEILVLTVVTQCIHATYLVLDRPLPPLPKPTTITKTTKTGAQAQENQPQPLDWSSMTRALPTQDDSVVWTPFFRPWHICWKEMAAAFSSSSSNKNNKNCLDANEQRTLQITLLLTGVPYLGATLAPVDLLKALVPVHRLYYLDEWVRTTTATTTTTTTTTTHTHKMRECLIRAYAKRELTNVCYAAAAAILLLVFSYVCFLLLLLCWFWWLQEMATVYGSLGPHRCAGVTRHDCEVISTTVAASYDCDF
jgi:hypothetical protein